MGYYRIVIMSDSISLVNDWEWYPEECPHCGQGFKTELKKDEPPTRHKRIKEGESKHGKYIELECTLCELSFQRHYPENDVTGDEDPLVSPSDWVIRSQFLKERTGLATREAHVQALKETGKSHADIAEVLDISESTVGEYSRRIKNRIEEAQNTLKEASHKVDVADILEGQFDGYLIVETAAWLCDECGDKREAGDNIIAALELTNGGWQTFAIYCSDCGLNDPNHAVHMHSLPLSEYIEENRNGGMTCAIIEGELEPLGEVRSGNGWLESEKSLTLKDVQVHQFLPALE